MAASMAQPPFAGGLLWTLQLGAKPKPLPASLTFAGQTVIITGANVGIGLECARELLALNASRLILAVRTVSKGEAAAEPLRQAHPSATIDIWALDMSSYASVTDFARRAADELPRLDAVILNAAMWCTDLVIGPHGHEEVFQVNYLSTALLSLLLLPTLRDKSPNGTPGRLAVVSSSMGLTAKFPESVAPVLLQAFDDPTQSYDVALGGERYATSKLLEQMFVYKLSQLVSPDEVIVNSVDPGFTGGSSLHRNQPFLTGGIFRILKVLVARSKEHAAWTYLDAIAMKGKESHGSLLVSWTVAPFHSLMHGAEGKTLMQRLWNETMDELSFAGVESIVKAMHRD